jgi:hypothetical protein
LYFGNQGTQSNEDECIILNYCATSYFSKYKLLLFASETLDIRISFVDNDILKFDISSRYLKGPLTYSLFGNVSYTLFSPNFGGFSYIYTGSTTDWKTPTKNFYGAPTNVSPPPPT